MVAAIVSALMPEQACSYFCPNDFVRVINYPQHEMIRFLFMTTQDRGVASVTYERPLGTPTKEKQVLLTAAILELVENNSTHNNATLDNLLPKGRHIHQVKSIVQYPNNQRTHNRACNCPDSTS